MIKDLEQEKGLKMINKRHIDWDKVKVRLLEVVLAVLGVTAVIVFMLSVLLLPYVLGYAVGWLLELLNGSPILILQTDLKIWLGVIFLLIAMIKSK